MYPKSSKKKKKENNDATTVHATTLQVDAIASWNIRKLDESLSAVIVLIGL